MSTMEPRWEALFSPRWRVLCYGAAFYLRRLAKCDRRFVDRVLARQREEAWELVEAGFLPRPIHDGLKAQLENPTGSREMRDVAQALVRFASSGAF